MNEEKIIRKVGHDDELSLKVFSTIIPGASEMQSAAYVGLKTGGVLSVAVVFIGFVFPAFVLLTLPESVYKSVINYPISIFIFSSLQAVLVSIISIATISFSNVTLKGRGSILITIINFFTFFTLMFRIDLYISGGGFASVPLMYHEIGNICHLLDNQTFLDGIALGQITPKPIVITTTFIGYTLSGLMGAIIGTISILLPSFLMLFGVTLVFNKLVTKKIFNEIIRRVLNLFVGLLFAVTIQFGLVLHWGAVQIFIGTAALIELLLNMDILYVILVGVAMLV